MEQAEALLLLRLGLVVQVQVQAVLWGRGVKGNERRCGDTEPWNLCPHLDAPCCIANHN